MYITVCIGSTYGTYGTAGERINKELTNVSEDDPTEVFMDISGLDLLLTKPITCLCLMEPTAIMIVL